MSRGSSKWYLGHTWNLENSNIFAKIGRKLLSSTSRGINEVIGDRCSWFYVFFFYLRAIAHAADPLWESKVGAWVMHFVSIFFILIFLKFKCHGVMLIQSFEEMPFVCLWIFDVIFSKFFVLRGSMMLATTVWHVKWKGPDTLLLEPIKKNRKKSYLQQRS